MTSIMAYVWRTGSNHDSVVQLSPTMALGPRLVVTGLFALGMLYFGLIIYTLRRYGDIMDEKWKKRVASWVKENIPREAYSHGSRSRNSHSMSMTAPIFAQMPLPATPVSTIYQNSTPHHSPRYGSGQPQPMQGFGPNLTPGAPTMFYPPLPQPIQQPGPWTSSPGYPMAGSPMQYGYYQPGFSLPTSPVAVNRGNLQPTSVRLPIQHSEPGPDPSALVPSQPLSRTSNVAVTVPGAHTRFPHFLEYGGARNPINLENTYKAILPVNLPEMDPFRVKMDVLPSTAPPPGARFATIRVMSLSTSAQNSTETVPEDLDAKNFRRQDWKKFITVRYNALLPPDANLTS